MNPDDDPAFAQALRESNTRIAALDAELHETHPIFQGNLAVAGMFVGYGLGAFVASWQSDDEILGHVRTIVAQIRETLGISNATH